MGNRTSRDRKYKAARRTGEGQRTKKLVLEHESEVNKDVCAYICVSTPEEYKIIPGK